jgi:hypothetical protein
MNYVTIKVSEDARRMLRLIAAQTGERMIQVMDRLCRDELEKVLVSQAQTKMEKQ